MKREKTMKKITLSFATLGLLAFALGADEEGRAVRAALDVASLGLWL